MMNLDGLEMIAVLVVMGLFIKVLEQFGLFEPVGGEGNECIWFSGHRPRSATARAERQRSRKEKCREPDRADAFLVVMHVLNRYSLCSPSPTSLCLKSPRSLVPSLTPRLHVPFFGLWKGLE
ncbi:hypothetical protein AOLI_G00190240 [Acnodon oligacanthus]